MTSAYSQERFPEMGDPLPRVSHEFFALNLNQLIVKDKNTFGKQQVFFVSLQRVHLFSQQIFPQLLGCRIFAVVYYGLLHGASTCEKLCW
jgi:hypothetical protein